jgi:hypothetical protein
MAPASATQPGSKKHPSRASSTSKTEADSPVLDVNGTEPVYLKELQKYVLRSHCGQGKPY